MTKDIPMWSRIYSRYHTNYRIIILLDRRLALARSPGQPPRALFVFHDVTIARLNPHLSQSSFSLAKSCIQHCVGSKTSLFFSSDCFQSYYEVGNLWIWWQCLWNWRNFMDGGWGRNNLHKRCMALCETSHRKMTERIRKSDEKVDQDTNEHCWHGYATMYCVCNQV